MARQSKRGSGFSPFFGCFAVAFALLGLVCTGCTSTGTGTGTGDQGRSAAVSTKPANDFDSIMTRVGQSRAIAAPRLAKGSDSTNGKESAQAVQAKTQSVAPKTPVAIPNKQPVSPAEQPAVASAPVVAVKSQTN